jgi:chromosome segregation ATPase
MSTEIDPVQAGGALLGAAASGGIIVKLIDRLWPTAAQRLKDNSDMRQELWDRLEQFERRIDTVQLELDGWKTKYYELLGEHHKLKAENHGIREENHKLLSRLTAVQLTMQRLQIQVDKFDSNIPPPTSDAPGKGLSILDEDLT